LLYCDALDFFAIAIVDLLSQLIIVDPLCFFSQYSKDMGEKQTGPTTIKCDNKSTIAMTRNENFNASQ